MSQQQEPRAGGAGGGGGQGGGDGNCAPSPRLSSLQHRLSRGLRKAGLTAGRRRQVIREHMRTVVEDLG